jgi:hypothetical protein
MSDENDPGKTLDALIELVEATHRAYAAGALVDLTGLDLEVEQVCRALTEAPRERRPAYIAKLETLVASFDGLAADMREAGR